MTDDDQETKLHWHDAIIEHERRIQLALLRVDGAEVTEWVGMNQQFGTVAEFNEAVEAWVHWLEDSCEHLDHYKREYLGEDIPQKYERGEGCPDCGGPLKMDTIGSSKCENCGERWCLATAEKVWWERVEDGG